MIDFDIPLRNGDTHTVMIPYDAPVVSIIGPARCGKTLAALMLAKNVIRVGREVHFYSAPFPAIGFCSENKDIALKIARDLQFQNPDLFYVHDILSSRKRTPIFSSDRRMPAEGSLLIIDEPEYAQIISEPETKYTIYDLVKNKGYTICACRRPPRTLNYLNRDEDIDILFVGLALIMVDRYSLSIWHNDSLHPDDKRLLDMLQDSNGRFFDKYSEFVAVDFGQGWMGISRFCIDQGDHNCVCT